MVLRVAVAAQRTIDGRHLATRAGWHETMMNIRRLSAFSRDIEQIRYIDTRERTIGLDAAPARRAWHVVGWARDIWGGSAQNLLLCFLGEHRATVGNVFAFGLRGINVVADVPIALVGQAALVGIGVFELHDALKRVEARQVRRATPHSPLSKRRGPCRCMSVDASP